MGRSSLVQSVERALRILEVLSAERGRPKGIAEIGRKTDMGKSAVHRLITTLEAHMFVEQGPETRKYKLGPALLEMGNIVLLNLELRNVAHPLLEDLMRRTGETVHMAILDKNHIVYIDKVGSTGAIRMASYVGLRSYVHSTALGKAIVAHIPEEELKAILDVVGMPRQTPNTITSFVELKANLQRIREVGYAVDDVENENDIRCVAAPVFDHQGRVIAAVSVSGTVLSIRADRVAEVAEQVMSTARGISAKLGCSGQRIAERR